MVPLEAPLTENAQVPPTATATMVPISPLAAGGVGVGGGVGGVGALVALPAVALVVGNGPAARGAVDAGGSLTATFPLGPAVAGARGSGGGGGGASSTATAEGAALASAASVPAGASPPGRSLRMTSAAITERTTTAPPTAMRAIFCPAGAGLTLGPPSTVWSADRGMTAGIPEPAATAFGALLGPGPEPGPELGPEPQGVAEGRLAARSIGGPRSELAGGCCDGG